MPLTQCSLALSQESCSRPCARAGGFSRPGPHAGPRDLIVLKHSSYCQILQCPLSLVSDLHICWNTVGCSLCSSDQLGVSLVPRGSGLCSHLSCCHLLRYLYLCILLLHFLLLFNYSCLNYPTTNFPHSTQHHIPPSKTAHLAFSTGPLYMFLDNISTSFHS